jgi:U3 small nucleolar ribonucleoprotein component
MEDFEEQDDVKRDLKIPLEAVDDADYGDEFQEEDDEAEDDEEDDAENEVFALARENKELNFANEEMVKRIEKIEDEMMDEKKW